MSVTPARERAMDTEAAYMLEEYVKLGAISKVHELHPEYSYMTIKNRITRALDQKTSLAADQHRKLQDEHLDIMMAKLLPEFQKADNDESLARISVPLMRVLERRAKLHGLDAAQQVQVSGEIISVSEETLAVMRTAQERLKVIAEHSGSAALKAVEGKSA